MLPSPRRTTLSLLLLVGGLAAPGAAQDSPLHRLQSEVERLAGTAGGTLGLTAIHLESGVEVSVRGDERFPMASTYKVPIAVRIFQQVDRGELRLDSLVTLAPGDLHPGSGTLTALFHQPGVTLPMLTLVELMLIISDNSATDLVLKAAGGPAAVTTRMQELGLGIRVDRPTVRLIADFVGIPSLPSDDVDPDTFQALAAAVSPEDQAAAARSFDADPRDTSSPREMATLLAAVHRGELLSPASTDELLDIMSRTSTGPGRLRGLLPPGSDVAHKTGTIGATANDVGILTLPDGAGHVVVAVFVREATSDIPTRERAIAQVTRAVYDYFLFTVTP